MKGIKARAWDKKNKRFGYFHLGTASINFPSLDYMEHNNTADETFDFPDVDWWELYTGLNDKNGKEIYEGDILWRNDPHVVIFGKEDFIEGVGFYLKDIPGNCVATLFAYTTPFKVVGNIHEDHELLESK